MRRYGNLFESIVSMENMELAYINARKGKTWQRAVKKFTLDVPGNLEGIRTTLMDGTFRTSPYKTKVIHIPKTRVIYILPFAPDRVAQHAVMNVLKPIWESLFITDSYACRDGKGAHAGSLRTMEFIRRNRYCLQCDIAKFYPSMRHDIAYRIVKQKIKCPRTLSLLKEIIYSPGGGSNVPIGNFTSQWLGNLYLNELDQFVKQTHRVRDYLRYCDDFLLFSNDKAFLAVMKQEIKDFLAQKLELTMSACELFPVSQGVDFLGYRHFPDYILLRKSTAKRVFKRFMILPHLLDAGKITLDQFRSSVASIAGWMKWAQTYHLAEKIRLNELAEALYG